ncbi:uncharacterized protein LACBIDRAFT_317528 [Laccaria bicolor S238N-H82]|uniref:Predicted protein n=1 Tax=Laccaria bicolor (strain S238N-H82 / ATCC MYA-4686) TaxID=486041 RepID=B0E1W8_LACBS|nr:uncharacterized protein LACBIDRAFT_317528 [Laccaria bicolor S238N-H82]EDQ99170.1 predicted protein [Laccaria bicolor S238N-H82]|eukprot:XP_001890187.1 predicted protein [Laccaria bicolor S238N-H82]
MIRTTCPLAPLRASTREEGTTSTKLGAPSVVVWLSFSTGPQRRLITFSSTTHSVLCDVSSRAKSRINVDLGLALTSTYYLKLPLRGQLSSYFFQAFPPY